MKHRVPTFRVATCFPIILLLFCVCLQYGYFFLSQDTRLAPSPLSALSHSSSAIPGLARQYALSLVNPPSYLNPWRESFLRGRLDWHNLVKDTFSVGEKGEAAAEALSRHLREEAKTTLLSLLQDSWGVFSRREYAPMGVRRGAESRWSAQRELVRVAESRSRALGVTLLDVLRDPKEVLHAADVVGVAESDISEERVDRVDGGPLTALEACPIVRDTCLLHQTLTSCIANSLCGWCPASSTCLTRGIGVEDGGVPCKPTPGTPRSEPVGALRLEQGEASAWLEGLPRGGINNGSGNTSSHALSINSTAASAVGTDASAQQQQQLRHSEARPLGELPGVLLVSGHTVPSPSSSQPSPNTCSILLQKETILSVDISGNSKMAYHWATETLPAWVSSAKSLPGGLGTVGNLVVYKGPWHELLALSYIFSGSNSFAFAKVVRIRS